MGRLRLTNFLSKVLRSLLCLAASAAFWSIGAPAAFAEDSSLKYPQHETLSPLSVDLQSGRFAYSKSDISIGPLTLTRTFVASGYFHPETHVFGTRFGGTKSSGWSHSFGQGIYGRSAGAPDI